MGRRSWTAAVGLLSVMVFVVACERPEPAPPPVDPAPAPAPGDTPPPTTTDLPPGVTQEMVAVGQQLFGTAGCAACHGPDARGTPLAPNLHDETWLNVSSRNYQEIIQLIRTGVDDPREAPAPMPPMGGANLTDEQVNQLAAYVVSLGG